MSNSQWNRNGWTKGVTGHDTQLGTGNIYCSGRQSSYKSHRTMSSANMIEKYRGGSPANR